MIFAVAQQAWLAWLAMGLFGVSNGLFFPAASSLVSFQAAPNSRGMILGLYNASGSAGRIIGPALSGPIYFSFGPGVPFALAAVLSAFAVVLKLVRLRKRLGPSWRHGAPPATAPAMRIPSPGLGSRTNKR